MFFEDLRGFVEDAGSIYLERERIKNYGATNQPGNAPYVETGQGHTGDTIVGRQVVPGVSNGALMAGVLVVLLAGGLVAAAVFD